MKRGKWSRRAPDRAPAGLYPDDEVDPGTFFGNRSRERTDVRTLRLCGEVAKAISLVFTGGCGDAVLQDLEVCSVTPAPNASRVLVTVCASDPRAPFDPIAAMIHLQRARGLLVAEITSAIRRKRAPELIFQVRP